jgi:RNA polymerase sigma-70 factor, ECF subfamily
MKESDEELVNKVRDGDDGGFTELYFRYVRLVLATLRKMGVLDCDLQDVTQDLFSHFYGQVMKGYPLPGRLSGHLSRLAVWKALDYHDQLKRTPSTPRIELDPAVPAETELPHEEMERTQFRTEVIRTLRNLPRKYREAIILKDYEELSYETIADILGLTVSAAKMRVSRARKAFAQAYSGEKTVTRGLFSRLIRHRSIGEEE